MTIYKHKRHTVWHFSFRWTDDHNYNLGYTDNAGSFIGTQKDFNEMIKNGQDGQGFCCWKVKKRHATKAEFEWFIYWLQ